MLTIAVDVGIQMENNIKRNEVANDLIKLESSKLSVGWQLTNGYTGSLRNRTKPNLTILR